MSHFAESRHACIVLGMHRSGTSALTHLIACLGGDLPLRLNPPAPDNPEGYFEPAVLVAIHEQLLAACGSVWFDLKPPALWMLPPETAAGLMDAMAQALDEDYAQAALPLIKDPRMCRFFPFARQVLARSGLACGVVLALRHPAEVAASLARRDQMSAVYAGLLWARHMISAERDSRGDPRITVGYADMMADWRPIAERIRRLPGQWRAADPDSPPLKAELRHHAGLDAVTLFGPRLGPLLEELHSALAGLVTRDEPPQHARIDAAGESIVAAMARRADLVEAEFLYRRLSTPNPFWQSPNPQEDRQMLAALFDRLHTT